MGSLDRYKSVHDSARLRCRTMYFLHSRKNSCMPMYEYLHFLVLKLFYSGGTEAVDEEVQDIMAQVLPSMSSIGNTLVTTMVSPPGDTTHSPMYSATHDALA